MIFFKFNMVLNFSDIRLCFRNHASLVRYACIYVCMYVCMN